MPDAAIHNGEMAAAISVETVKALAEYTGRGPTKARTTMADNAIFVVVEDALTKGERSLADSGDHQTVLDLRRKWQSIMRADLSATIEKITSREIIGFMSDNHIEPDLGVEVFILKPI